MNKKYIQIIVAFLSLFFVTFAQEEVKTETDPSDEKTTEEVPTQKKYSFDTKSIIAISKTASLGGDLAVGLDEMNKFLIANLQKRIKKLTPQTTEICDHAIAAYKTLDTLTKSNIDSKNYVVSWLLSNSDRTKVYGQSFAVGYNNPKESIEILSDLVKEIPAVERDKYYQLLIAISLVWDKQSNPYHHQIGEKILNASKIKPVDIAKYFINLYEKKQAKINYGDLNFIDLLFVVDVKIPMSELEWAKKNVPGSLKNWGDNYAKIKYDHPRLNKGEFTWPTKNGDYSLANIQKKGGICVDQAYYTVLSARANGIPAIYLSGSGRNGGHAWAGILSSNGKWNLDIGRYSQSNFAVGNTIHPQTGMYIADNEIEFYCDKQFRSGKYLLGQQKMNIAAHIASQQLLDKSEYNQKVKVAQDEFKKNGDSSSSQEESYISRFNANTPEFRVAVRLAKEISKETPLIPDAWNYEEESLLIKRNPKQLEEFYKRKILAYNKYLDISALLKLKLLKIYSSSKQNDKAKAMVPILIKETAKSRFDIACNVACNEFDSLLNNGDEKGALSFYDSFIRKYKNEEVLLIPLIHRYSYLGLNSKDENIRKTVTKTLVKYFKDVYPNYFIANKANLEKIVRDVCEENADKNGLRDIDNIVKRSNQKK